MEVAVYSISIVTNSGRKKMKYVVEENREGAWRDCGGPQSLPASSGRPHRQRHAFLEAQPPLGRPQHARCPTSTQPWWLPTQHAKVRNVWFGTFSFVIVFACLSSHATVRGSIPHATPAVNLFCSADRPTSFPCGFVWRRLACAAPEMHLRCT